MMPVIDERFSCDTQAARHARRSIEGLRDSLSKSEARDLDLLISELVSNSVMHGGLGSEDLIGLKVYLSVALIRSEVSNAGAGFELGDGSLLGGGILENMPRLDQISGWGLQLVANLTDRWGAHAEAAHAEAAHAEAAQGLGEQQGMTVVWFEIDRDPGASSAGTAPGRT